MNALAPACLLFLLPLFMKPRLTVIGLLILGSFFKEPDFNTLEEWQKIKAFIHSVHPGATIVITPHDQRPDDPAFERIPFLWRGYQIWIRRHHIYDKVKESA